VFFKGVHVMTWQQSRKSFSRWALVTAPFFAAFGIASCSSEPQDATPTTAGAGGRPGTTTTGGASGSGGAGPGSNKGDWCATQKVLHDNCLGCHGKQPFFGAPMSLVTFDDLHARSLTTPSQYVYELVKRRIHDVQKPMPPASTNDVLTRSELETLDAWLDNGRAGKSASCPPGVIDAGTGAGGTGGTGAGGAGGTGAGGAGKGGAGGATAGGAGGAATGGASGTGAGGTGAGGTADGGGKGGAAGSGGASGAAGGNPGDGGTAPPGDWPADCEQRFTMRAHGVSQPGDMTKFNVSTAPSKQFYQCFMFKVPWGADAVQALRFRSIVDDARVVHHWLLYGTPNGTGPDGQVGGNGCSGSSAALLAGWAPGNTEPVLPADVGLLLPSGASAYLGLEVHYNNTASYPDSLDASGVEFCVTKKFRPKTAGVHWLGSNAILLAPRAMQNVVGTCDPVTREPIHILSIWPHMHQLGTRMSMVLNRAGGAKETLHDAPFSFDDQRSYAKNVTVNDGDTITSTCSFNNTTSLPVTFGPNTENEMCYNFVTAWPANALSAAAGSDHCLQ
jgi:hypothetical protein